MTADKMACAIAIQLKPTRRAHNLLKHLQYRTPGVRYSAGRDALTVHADFEQPYVTWQQGQASLADVLDRLDPEWFKSIKFGPSLTYGNPA